MTLDEAILDLRSQSFARGMKGKLEDFDVYLCEDGQTVSIWAMFYLDEPLMTQVDLPAGPSNFDRNAFYYAIEEACARNSAQAH